MKVLLTKTCVLIFCINAIFMMFRGAGIVKNSFLIPIFLCFFWSLITYFFNYFCKKNQLVKIMLFFMICSTVICMIIYFLALRYPCLNSAHLTVCSFFRNNIEIIRALSSYYSLSFSASMSIVSLFLIWSESNIPVKKTNLILIVGNLILCFLLGGMYFFKKDLFYLVIMIFLLFPFVGGKEYKNIYFSEERLFFVITFIMTFFPLVFLLSDFMASPL